MGDAGRDLTRRLRLLLHQPAIWRTDRRRPRALRKASVLVGRLEALHRTRLLFRRLRCRTQSSARHRGCARLASNSSGRRACRRRKTGSRWATPAPTKTHRACQARADLVQCIRNERGRQLRRPPQISIQSNAQRHAFCCLFAAIRRRPMRPRPASADMNRSAAGGSGTGPGSP